MILKLTRDVKSSELDSRGLFISYYWRLISEAARQRKRGAAIIVYQP